MMDLVKVDCNWTSSQPLQELLLITYQNTWDDTAVGGDINDDFVILTEPNADLLNDSHCCSIGIDCSAHTGYRLQGVLLVSGVRSVESYVGDDVAYIGTNRGAFIKLTDDDRQRYGRLYRCVIDLTSEDTSFITIKLPSLKGSSRVALHKLCVMVSNSNDGTGMGGATKGRHQQLPIGDDDVFSLLQRSSNVPPFMTSLVTALKTSQVSADNIDGLTAMFRQIRKPDTPPPATEDSKKEEKDFVENVAEEESMESRLREYIDKKLHALQIHLDNQLKQMKHEILREINKK